MAKNIPDLPALTSADATDLFEVYDVSANTNKKVAVAGLTPGLTGITNSQLSTTTGEPGGSWQSWTPSYANLTVGNGSVVARYMQVGKTVHVRYSLTWGSTTTFTASSNISISPPVPISTNYTSFSTVGVSQYFDTSSSLIYTSTVTFESTSSMRPFVTIVDAVHARLGQVNNSAPMTWATGDVFSFYCSYEAA